MGESRNLVILSAVPFLTRVSIVAHEIMIVETMKSRFLGCKAMKFGEYLTFWGNILPSSSGLKCEPSKTPAEAGTKRNLL